MVTLVLPCTVSEILQVFCVPDPTVFYPIFDQITHLPAPLNLFVTLLFLLRLLLLLLIQALLDCVAHYNFTYLCMYVCNDDDTVEYKP